MHTHPYVVWLSNKANTFMEWALFQWLSGQYSSVVKVKLIPGRYEKPLQNIHWAWISVHTPKHRDSAGISDGLHHNAETLITFSSKKTTIFYLHSIKLPLSTCMHSITTRSLLPWNWTDSVNMQQQQHKHLCPFWTKSISHSKRQLPYWARCRHNTSGWIPCK